MAKRLQHRGGTTSQHSTFTGAVREVTVDTDKNTLVVHDGATAGGHPLATATNFTSTGIDDNATSTAITIDSSQNVDVAGTITADGLTVQNNGVLAGISISGNNAPALKIQDTTSSAYGVLYGQNSGVLILDADNTNIDASSSLSLRHDGKQAIVIGSGGDISFYEDTGTTPKMFWDASAESLGIGTSSPTGRLNIVTATTDGVNTLFGAAVSPNAAGMYVGFNDSDATATLGVYYASNPIPAINITRSDRTIKFMNDATERMRIDSSGNVGIGETSMDALLVIKGNSDENTTPSIRLKDGSDTREAWITNNAGDLILSAGGNDNVPHTQLRMLNGDLMTFKTANTERMRISSNGAVGINSTATTLPLGVARLVVQGGNTSEYVGIDKFGVITVEKSTTITQYAMEFRNPNGLVGRITTSGLATAYNTSSDYRLKENVNYDFDATTRLKQLKPARFNFIADTDKTVDGFIAHEVSSIVPEAISGEKDETETKEKVVVNANGQVIAENIEQADWETGKIADEDGNTKYPTDSTWEATKVFPIYQGIDQSKLVPLLVKTIQELEARITALETNQP